ncbi:MAG TPA: hypothetical protein VE616_02000, partial [Candidatus Udaeobacter sp.]|nr:hypothetical protein [Candidatus Udaeobacter sp.]
SPKSAPQRKSSPSPRFTCLREPSDRARRILRRRKKIPSRYPFIALGEAVRVSLQDPAPLRDAR